MCRIMLIQGFCSNCLTVPIIKNNFSSPGRSLSGCSISLWARGSPCTSVAGSPTAVGARGQEATNPGVSHIRCSSLPFQSGNQWGKCPRVRLEAHTIPVASFTFCSCLYYDTSTITVACCSGSVCENRNHVFLTLHSCSYPTSVPSLWH